MGLARDGIAIARPATSRTTILLAVGGLGFLLRLALWYWSEGSNDIRAWVRFAQSIDAHGLGGTYVREQIFNHPPPMGLLAQAIWHGAPHIGLSFVHAFKLVGLLADLGTALLLAEIWRRRNGPAAAATAFAAYGCALCAILISGFHGNTDCLYWFLALAAVYLLQDRNAPLLAGLALGAALNVKLIPVLLVLPLAACCRSPREAGRYALGGAIALAPFALLVLQLDAVERAAFFRNVFGYVSYPESWGIELIARALVAAFQQSAPAVAAAVANAAAFYAQHAAPVLLGATAALAAWRVVDGRAPMDAYSMAALSMCLFLILTPGFGVQYVGVVVPLLLALRIRDGFAVASMAGVFIGLIYLSFVTSWSPISTRHFSFPPAFSAPSFATWWLLVACSVRILRTRRWDVPASSRA